MTTYSRVTTIPGEYEVAHLTDIVHLNSVESVTGVAPGGGGLLLTNGHGAAAASGAGTGSGVDSWLHASVSAQTQSAFWKGNLHLSNYQLSFLVSDGAHAGHHALGYHSAPTSLPLDASAAALAHGVDPAHAHALQPLHPNLDASNFSLLHVPVGSIFKLEYSRYSGFAPSSKKEKAGEGDYSSYSADSYSVAAASAAAAAADSTLRDIEFQLQITTRDARVLSFGILRRASLASAGIITGSSSASGSDATAQSAEDRAAGVAEFLRLLKKYAFPKETRKLFAFSYMGGGRGAGGDARGSGGHAAEGWACYDVVREFARMGVGVHPADAARGLSLVHPRRRAQWRLDTVTNARFEFSPTYPQAYWLPVALTEKELGKVKGFRSKARIPALVYNYSDLLDYQGLGLNAQSYPDTVILRAAQPNVGWTFGRCTADERLLELAQIRVIIDARPHVNAVANQAKGGGYENADHYKQCRIEFMGIENIHVMRTSLSSLLELLRANSLNGYASGQSNSGDDWWSGLQQSGWLKHMRILLEGAVVCANYVKNGTSILIHCSDGWDRTSQLTSLAQLMLDPYYRTRAGFAVLVEKEWISFGHQFHKRCGHGHKEASEGQERSPIFYQFLDAIWQIMQQHPCAFEFNADYLAAVADHLYSSKFGTFLHDNERLRALDHVKHTTQSLWSEINSDARREHFRNPLYGAGGVATPSGMGVWGDRAANALGGVMVPPLAGPNNPSMNLHALTGADLGRAGFLHVSADPRRIGIWPYWFRWERRKQSHAPLMHLSAAQLALASGVAAAAASPADGNGALPITLPSSSSLHAAHLHHSPLAQLTTFALGQLAQERSRVAALEATVAALEADAKRLDAALIARTIEANAARALRGEQPHVLPPTFRQAHAGGSLGEPASVASTPRSVPPPPPPQQARGYPTLGRPASSPTANGTATTAAPSVPSVAADPVDAPASAGGAAAAVRRVCGTNTRGSIVVADGKSARGSIMTFGSNPLLDTEELPSPLTGQTLDSDEEDGTLQPNPMLSNTTLSEPLPVVAAPSTPAVPVLPATQPPTVPSPSQLRLPLPPPLPATAAPPMQTALPALAMPQLPLGFVPPLPPGPPPAPRVAPAAVNASAVAATAVASTAAPSVASPLPTAAAAADAAVSPSSAPAAAPSVVPPVGPPQFRISALAFQNVKLKSTAKRFEMAASFTSTVAASPAQATALAPAVSTPPSAALPAPSSSLLSAALAAEPEEIETVGACVPRVNAVSAVAAAAAPSQSLLTAAALGADGEAEEQLDAPAPLTPVAAATLPPPPPPPTAASAPLRMPPPPPPHALDELEMDLPSPPLPPQA